MLFIMSRTTQEIFIENLVRIRKNKQFSQSLLADIANVSTGIIGEIENGHRNPTLKTIDKIAKALETPPYVFFLDNQTENDASQYCSNEEKKKKIIELLNSMNL